MKKLFALLAISGSLVFGAMNLQTASKEELMSIKGIGEKKAEQIIEYRKTNTIKSADDLKNIKGFGDNIVTNIKENKGDGSLDKAKRKLDGTSDKLDKKLDKEDENSDKKEKK